MANSGWIKIHRKMLDWEWYRDGNTFRLFTHLLLSANHCEQKWQGLLIGRGQLVTGRKALSEQTGLSEQEIRTSLNRLKTTNEITIKTTSKYSVITINNYDTCQQYEIENGQQINQQINQQSTSGQPTTNQQSTTNKNIENAKNGKNVEKTPPLPPTEKNQQNQGFQDVEEMDKSRKYESLSDRLTTQDSVEASIPENSIAFLWNQFCFNLPKVVEFSKARKAKEKIRLSERPFESWKEVFTKLSNSDFCRGGNERGWIASYDWIISNSENSIKAIEGKYDNRESVSVLKNGLQALQDKNVEVLRGWLEKKQEGME